MKQHQSTPIRFSPFDGYPLAPAGAPRGYMTYHWHFNPWTGAPRTAAAIAHDPYGLLIVPPEEVQSEIGWVIARDLPKGLGYWDGIRFSLENLAAIRFSRKEDASRYLQLLHAGAENPDRVEQHAWISAPPITGE